METLFYPSLLFGSDLHHLPELLFFIRRKSSKLKNGSNSLIDFGSGLMMEMGVVREVPKHFCLEKTAIKLKC